MTQLPDGWEKSTVVQFLDAPYSDEALAQPVKTWIDAAELDLAGLPPGDQSWAWGRTIKAPGANFYPSAHPELYVPLHTSFTDAARQILGEQLYSQANIYFDHSSSHLRPGQTFTFDEPHLDGTMPGASRVDTSFGDEQLELKLFGVAFNAAGSDVWQGSTYPSDYTGDSGTHLKPGVIEARGLEHDQLPTDRLIIAPPSLLHAAHPADEYIPMRHFLRWQLKV